MVTNEIAVLTVSSTAFDNEGLISAKYTCDEEEVNPPLQIENIPGNAQALAIIAEDPDAPKGTFDHWLVWNIPVDASIKENFELGINGVNEQEMQIITDHVRHQVFTVITFMYLHWIQNLILLLAKYANTKKSNGTAYCSKRTTDGQIPEAAQWIIKFTNYFPGLCLFFPIFLAG